MVACPGPARAPGAVTSCLVLLYTTSCVSTSQGLCYHTSPVLLILHHCLKSHNFLILQRITACTTVFCIKLLLLELNLVKQSCRQIRKDSEKVSLMSLNGLANSVQTSWPFDSMTMRYCRATQLHCWLLVNNTTCKKNYLPCTWLQSIKLLQFQKSSVV